MSASSANASPMNRESGNSIGECEFRPEAVKARIEFAGGKRFRGESRDVTECVLDEDASTGRFHEYSLDGEQTATGFDFVSTSRKQNTWKSKARIRDDCTLPGTRDGKRRRLVTCHISGPCHSTDSCSECDANARNDSVAGGDGDSTQTNDEIQIQAISVTPTLASSGNSSPDVASSARIMDRDITSERNDPTRSFRRSQMTTRKTTAEEEIIVHVPATVLASLLSGNCDQPQEMEAMSKTVTALVSAYLEKPDVVEVAESPSLDSPAASESEEDEQDDEPGIPDSHQSCNRTASALTSLEGANGGISGISTEEAAVDSTDACSEFEPEQEWKYPSLRDTIPIALSWLQLEELQIACCVWTDHSDSSLRPVQSSLTHQFSGADFFNLLYNGIHLIVKQYACLVSVKNLPLYDQRVLLKAAARELLLFNGIMKYDSRTDRINVQNPGCEYIDLAVFKKVQGTTVHETYKRLHTSFPDKLRTNECAMLLLGTLILLNPHRPSLVDKMAVQRERLVYMGLLKDCLESTYGRMEGSRALEYLLAQLNEVSKWVKLSASEMTFELDYSTMRPVSFQVYCPSA